MDSTDIEIFLGLDVGKTGHWACSLHSRRHQNLEQNPAHRRSQTHDCLRRRHFYNSANQGKQKQKKTGRPGGETAREDCTRGRTCYRNRAGQYVSRKTLNAQKSVCRQQPTGIVIEGRQAKGQSCRTNWISKRNGLNSSPSSTPRSAVQWCSRSRSHGTKAGSLTAKTLKT